MTDQGSHSSPIPTIHVLSQADADPPPAQEKLDVGNSASAVSEVMETHLASTLVDIYDAGVVDPVYQAKSHAISCAIQKIGMGRYQVRASIFERH